MKRNVALRRQSLVERTRLPAPNTYAYAPCNRAQRRRMERELRRLAGRAKAG